MRHSRLLAFWLCFFPTATLLAQSNQDRSPAPKQHAAEVAKKEPEWTVLFDGKEMKGWELVKGIDYREAGPVEVRDGALVLGMGDPATGLRWSGKFPQMNYEIELEAQRVDGNDFFCGLSFPVGDGALTLILGGWGGWVTGLSCVDGNRAIDNETCSSTEFKNKQWYRVRVRVTKHQVSAYLDETRICSLETDHRKLTVTYEMEPCLPLGLATWITTGAVRNIRYRTLPEDEQGSDNKRP